MTQDLFFHEDHYLQVEIIPQANLFDETRKLSELAYEFSDYGYTNISFRSEKKKPTASLGIAADALANYLNQYSLLEYEKTCSGYSSTTLVQEHTRSFAFENYAIVFNHASGIVQNIWVVFSPQTKNPTTAYAGLSAALHNMGCKYDLILVDWNEERIVSLKKMQTIRDYLLDL